MILTKLDRPTYANEQAECELRKLRAIASTAKTYFNNYLQDEAEEIECCVCGDEQHRRAIALRDALQSLTPNVGIERLRSSPLE